MCIPRGDGYHHDKKVHQKNAAQTRRRYFAGMNQRTRRAQLNMVSQCPNEKAITALTPKSIRNLENTEAQHQAEKKNTYINHFRNWIEYFHGVPGQMFLPLEDDKMSFNEQQPLHSYHRIIITAKGIFGAEFDSGKDKKIIVKQVSPNSVADIYDIKEGDEILDPHDHHPKNRDNFTQEFNISIHAIRPMVFDIYQ